MVDLAGVCEGHLLSAATTNSRDCTARVKRDKHTNGCLLECVMDCHNLQRRANDIFVLKLDKLRLNTA